MGDSGTILKINKEHTYYHFDPRLSPVIKASKGDTVIFETKDCFNDEILSETDTVAKINMSRINPVTGPLYIEGANPGSVLALRIEKIALRKWGVLTLSPNSGVMNEYLNSPYTKIVKIDQEVGYARFSENIHIPLRPHVGTIGTTPQLRIPSGRTGDHGGNMDIRFVTNGSILYLPVFVQGGLVMMGDVHAAMGDGEIAIGVETGADVTVKILDILDGMTIPSPIVETSTHWITYADAPSGKLGVKEVSKRMTQFLSRKSGISLEDATLLVSTAGDLRIAQWAESGYNYTFYLKFPKGVFTDNSLSEFK